MSSTRYHILVIGGGIGGLCLAQGLKATGVSVAVFERNANPVDWLQGYRIHVNPIGSRALHECLPPMLWDAFAAAAGKPPAGLGFLTEQLEELVVIAEDFMAGGAASPVDDHYPVNRIALRHLLLAGIQDVVHFDKAFQRYERTPDGKVTAFFADGSSATGDVLIAADGANSRVRQQYLPQAKRVEIGATAIGGKLPLTDQTRAWLPRQISTRMNIIWPSSPYILFNAVFENKPISAEARHNIDERAVAAGLDSELLFHNTESYILWAFIAHSHTYPRDIQNLNEYGLQQFVMRKIENWHPTLRRLVAESDPQSLALVPFKASAPIAPWKSTNITLLGDAIHNMPPVGGFGANLALRDASLLSRKLVAVQRGEVPLVTAIRDYEAEMLKYSFSTVQASLDTTHQAISQNPFAREAAKLWFRLCNVMPPLKHMFEESWTAHMRNQPSDRGESDADSTRELINQAF